jgi:hypothetical protein
MLKIERQNDSRVVKTILHRIADIPGGVGVKASLLGGDKLYEGTPLAVGTDGLYEVVKSAVVYEDYTAADASIKVKKGSHFKVGDKISDAAYSDFSVIAAIDKTNAAYDLITLSANTLSVDVDENEIIVECSALLNTAATRDGVVQGAHATATVTEIKVDKGHGFLVGDIIAGTGTDPMTGKTIVSINRGYDGYDVISFGSTQIGKALADNEELISVTEVSGTTEKTYSVQYVNKKATPVAIVGSNEDVVSTENLHVSAWVIAVARETEKAPLTDAFKADLRNIVYVV